MALPSGTSGSLIIMTINSLAWLSDGPSVAHHGSGKESNGNVEKAPGETIMPHSLFLSVSDIAMRIGM